MEHATIVIADDHPLFCDALTQSIQGLPINCDIKIAGTLEEAAELLQQNHDLDLLMLDLNMPGSRGFSGLMQLRASFPSVPVAVVSASEDAGTVKRSIELGASGFIPKSSSMETIREATVAILKGDIWLPKDYDPSEPDDAESAAISGRIQTLTPQQRRVLAMLGKGLLNKQIAYELGVSEATVKAHVSAVLLKLEVDSRTQAVIAMNKIGAAVIAPSDHGVEDNIA